MDVCVYLLVMGREIITQRFKTLDENKKKDLALNDQNLNFFDNKSRY